MNEVQQIELSIEQSQSMVDMKNSFEKLRKNRDFKKVIEENYFEKEASRLVLLKADPNCQTDEIQKDIDNQIIAIGNFRQYLINLMRLGAQAEVSIHEANKAREEALQEELEGES